MTHVIDKIANAEKYAAAYPVLAKAIAFLKRPDLRTLKPGRYGIDGENCWASIQEATLHPFEGARLEAHRAYIDIQAPLTGHETIGLAEATDAELSEPFDEEKDVFFYEAPMKPVTLRPGDFAIFFPPRGAHAPCCQLDGATSVRKLVVKIRAN